jgi:hypothetical protein
VLISLANIPAACPCSGTWRVAASASAPLRAIPRALPAPVSRPSRASRPAIKNQESKIQNQKSAIFILHPSSFLLPPTIDY